MKFISPLLTLLIILFFAIIHVADVSGLDVPTGTDQTQLEKEISFYLEKTAAAPYDALHFSYLADAYIKKARMTGDARWNDLARDAAHTSLKNSPDNSGANIALASLAQTRHDFSEARRLLDNVLSQHPIDAGALGVSVVVHLAQGNPGQASRDADLLLAALPNSPGAHTYAALAFESQGRNDEAEYHYAQALRWLESDQAAAEAWIRALYGRFFFRKGRYAEAREMYTKALRVLPGYHLGLFWLARLASTEANFDASRDYYAQAYQLFHSPLYLFEQSQVMRMAGDATGADQLRMQSLEIYNALAVIDSTGHRTEIARILLDIGGTENISKALASVSDESTKRRDHETLFILSRAYYLSGRYEESRRILQDIFRTGIKIADYYHHAGLIERALDRPERARFYFELALKTNPRFDPAEQELSAIRKPRWWKVARISIVVASVMFLLILAMYVRFRKGAGAAGKLPARD